MTFTSWPTYTIYTITEDSHVIECFHWVRDPMAGMRRAKKDAKEFGVNCVSFFADEIIGPHQSKTVLEMNVEDIR